MAAALNASPVIAGGLPETGTGDGATNSQSSNISPATSALASSASASSASANTTATSAATSANSGNSGDGTGFVAIEDDPLIVDTSAIMDNDGMGKVQVQWQVSSDGDNWMNLTGAIQQSFTPRQSHVGKRLRVQISYVDGQGNLETLVSPPSTPVQNVNDKPTGAPQLAGIAREEEALVVG